MSQAALPALLCRLSCGAVPDRESMVITGRILEIMESWPLQLAIEAEGVRYHVELLDETLALKRGAPVDVGSLQQGQRVRASGLASEASATAMSASRIEVLE